MCASPGTLSVYNGLCDLQAPVCPGAYTATGCCYKNCKSETIPKNAIQTTIHPSDGWDIVSDALIGAAEDIYEVVCDFGGAVCEYADSDVGEAVDTIAKITTKVPGVVGEASQAYKKIKKTLTRAFMCRNGDSITCAATSAALSSGAARSCPATTKTAFLLGTTLAVSHCTLL